MCREEHARWRRSREEERGRATRVAASVPLAASCLSLTGTCLSEADVSEAEVSEAVRRACARATKEEPPRRQQGRGSKEAPPWCLFLAFLRGSKEAPPWCLLERLRRHQVTGACGAFLPRRTRQCPVWPCGRMFDLCRGVKGVCESPVSRCQGCLPYK